MFRLSADCLSFAGPPLANGKGNAENHLCIASTLHDVLDGALAWPRGQHPTAHEVKNPVPEEPPVERTLFTGAGSLYLANMCTALHQVRHGGASSTASHSSNRLLRVDGLGLCQVVILFRCDVFRGYRARAGGQTVRRGGATRGSNVSTQESGGARQQPSLQFEGVEDRKQLTGCFRPDTCPTPSSRGLAIWAGARSPSLASNGPGPKQS